MWIPLGVIILPTTSSKKRWESKSKKNGLKFLSKNDLQSRISYEITEGKIKIFPDMQGLKKFTFHTILSRELLENIL